MSDLRLLRVKIQFLLPGNLRVGNQQKKIEKVKKTANPINISLQTLLFHVAVFHYPPLQEVEKQTLSAPLKISGLVIDLKHNLLLAG